MVRRKIGVLRKKGNFVLLRKRRPNSKLFLLVIERRGTFLGDQQIKSAIDNTENKPIFERKLNRLAKTEKKAVKIAKKFGKATREAGVKSAKGIFSFFEKATRPEKTKKGRNWQMAIEDILEIGLIGILSVLILASFVSGIRPTLASLLDNASNFPNAALELGIFDLILLTFIFIILIAMLRWIRQPQQPGTSVG